MKFLKLEAKWVKNILPKTLPECWKVIEWHQTVQKAVHEKNTVYILATTAPSLG